MFSRLKTIWTRLSDFSTAITLGQVVWWIVSAGGGVALSLWSANQYAMPVAVLIGLVTFAALIWLFNGLAWRRHHLVFAGATTRGGTSQVSSKPEATGQDLLASHVKNKVIRILAVGANGVVIRGKVYEDCDFIGPGIVGFMENNVLDGCGFAYEGKIDSILWTIPKGKVVVGAIGFLSCVFRRCTFNGIGFAGEREWIKQLKTSIPDRGYI